MRKRGERGLGQASLRIIETAIAIVAARAPITVRGVCYQLFVQGIIPSMEKKETGKVGRLLVYAREHDLIDWDDIVDESRRTEGPAMWTDLGRYAEVVARSYRRDFWQTQTTCVQLWSEKATVGGILRPVTDEYGVPFLAVHGFGSATSLHDAAVASVIDPRDSVILYVGDHDPSGCYMSEQDLPDRMVSKYGGAVEIVRIALTRDDTFGLPSFPAKPTDPRFKWYRERYGLDAWELDAMDPNALRARVEEKITLFINHEEWERAKLVEEAEQKTAKRIAAAMGQEQICH